MQMMKTTMIKTLKLDVDYDDDDDENIDDNIVVVQVQGGSHQC